MTDTATETATFQLGSVGVLMTNRGLDVLSEGLRGEQIKFSRVALGDGIITAESLEDYYQKVLDLEDIINWRMDVPIVEATNLGNGEFLLHVINNNALVPEGFFARERAVYAIDQKTGKEILYSYINTGDASSFIPSNTGPIVKVIEFSIHTVIQNAPNVVAVIDQSFAYVSLDRYYDHVDSAHPHPNTPNHYLNVSDTNKIWAIDEDDHLHQITVGNARQVLLGDAAKLIPSMGKIISESQLKIDELSIFNQAKNELGLDANLMIVEDFNPATEIDDFKVKVLSCARGGRLIGVASDAGIMKGAYYWIADGVNQEMIQVKGVAYSTDYYRVTLENALTYDYNLDAVNMYRTTFAQEVGTIDKKSLKWTPPKNFTGIEANVPRELVFDTSHANRDALIVEGEGLLTSDGYFSLTQRSIGI